MTPVHREEKNGVSSRCVGELRHTEKTACAVWLGVAVLTFGPKRVHHLGRDRRYGALTLQWSMDEEDTPMRLGYDLDDDGQEAGSEPWALGDLDLEPFELGDKDGRIGEADSWLDKQLGEFRSDESARDEPYESATSDPEATGAKSGGEVMLRRPSPTRSPRRRRADPEAVADLPPAVVPGYVRDRRGTWRYAATGQAVPGARDLTLRSLYRFPVGRGHVHVPVELVRSESELGWCMAWRQTLSTALHGGRVVTVLRIPVGEWERRADIPIGLWAPELTASRLLGIAQVAHLAGVSSATITAYLARRRVPVPVTRIGNSPVWSRPIIDEWLATRPGQGVRSQKPVGVDRPGFGRGRST